MQELQPVPGLAGRLLAGGGAAANGLRRRHGGSSSAAEVRCPRCDSPDTKFCYYNNYNLAQPRHFCRACRRYWTKGGHLRNVPVGGSCRKPKPRRPSSADGPGMGGVHRDGKAPRSGFAASDGDGDAPVSAAFSDVITEPSGTSGGGRGVEASAGTGSFAAGDTLALLVPPPAPMFADQASVFASLLAPPRPLPALGSSAQPQPEQAEERVAARLLAAEQPPPPCTAAATDTAPFAAGSDDGALAAGVSDWPTAASFAGMLELSPGRIAGDASLLPEYWSSGNWPEYLP